MPQRTKDYLWIERRQIWNLRKWQFTKGKPHVRMRCLILIGHVNYEL